jgi:translation initiation factor IF-2
MALGSIKASVVGFNVKIDSQAKTLAERDGVEIVTFDIIYKLSEWIAEKLVENKPMQEFEEITGTAKVLKIFSKVKDKQIIGCRVENGKILVGEQVKIIRREAEIGTGKIREMQSQKQKISEIEEGKEFGTMVEAKIEIAPGDRLQAVTLVKK